MSRYDHVDNRRSDERYGQMVMATYSHTSAMETDDDGGTAKWPKEVLMMIILIVLLFTIRG